jgi:DcaP outer membrane protein/Porin subfamily
MTIRWILSSAAAIGGIAATLSLLLGPSTARADELADLRANQELLQQRIDQLSQAPVGAVPFPGQYVPGYGPPSGPAGPNQPVVSGSFPRSFLIPGTDTSLRIGGFANVVIQEYFTGANQGGQLDGQGGINNTTFINGPGGTGNLTGIPLNNAPGASRNSAFDISPNLSRLVVDARTPTAWGEIKAYMEWDWAYNNTNVVQSNALGTGSNYFARLRKAYGTFGGFEAGQDTGLLHDPDADPELIDAEATGNGRARQAQINYTYAGPYGTVFRAGFENPVARFQGPFGQVDQDTNQIPNISACSVTGNITAATPATTACLGSLAFLSPLQVSMPEWIATARVNQPWGHVQIGGVLREDKLDDAQYLNQKFLGFAGTISGDAHPFSGNPGPLGKDDLGFGMAAGQDAGNQIANGTGPVSNFGAPLFVPGVGLVNPLESAAWNARDGNTNTIGCVTLNSGACVNGVNVRSAYDKLVSSQASESYGAWIWYQHWWNDELRSTIEASGIWNAMNTNILCTNTESASATNVEGSGCNNGNNKLLTMAHANLFWSPVAFVDFGLEYSYGHRVTVNNFKGDSNVLLGQFRVRF